MWCHGVGQKEESHVNTNEGGEWGWGCKWVCARQNLFQFIFVCRNDGPMSIRTQQSLHENRYWRDASLNISISYMQLFGEINMRGHYPGPCYGRQDQECGPQSMTKENWARAGHVLTEPEYEKWVLLLQEAIVKDLSHSKECVELSSLAMSMNSGRFQKWAEDWLCELSW